MLPYKACGLAWLRLMQTNFGLFSTSSFEEEMDKDAEADHKTSSNRSRRMVCGLAVLLILLLFCELARSDYFPPALPESNIIHQTFITVALPANASTIHIDVNEYDARQMVKNITINFSEPITYVGLAIDILKDKPLILNSPKTAPIIQYYDIRFLNELSDKIANVKVVFAVEKATLQNMSAKDSLLHYQYKENKFETCTTQKVFDNKTHLFFETETTISPCFVITGADLPTPQWSWLMLTAVVAILAIVTLLVRRKYVSNRLQVK